MKLRSYVWPLIGVLILAFFNSGCDNDFLIKNKKSIEKILVKHTWKEISFYYNNPDRDYNTWVFTDDGKIVITFNHYPDVAYDTVHATYNVKSRIFNARIEIDAEPDQLIKYPDIRGKKGVTKSDDGRWKIIHLKKSKVNGTEKYVLRMARTGGQPDPNNKTLILGGIVMKEFTADL